MNRDIFQLIYFRTFMVDFEFMVQKLERPIENGVKACWVAGWGRTYYSRYASATDQLNQGGLNILSNRYNHEYCKEHVKQSGREYRLYQKIQKDEICAGTPDRDGDGLVDYGVTACTGDSGGPLICDDNGTATLYGIISWGHICGRLRD
mgnify:CR=1 FL=1